LSLTKLQTNSTNKNLLKIQTRASFKLEPKFESEIVAILYLLIGGTVGASMLTLTR
jgi:hypothetical protein